MLSAVSGALRMLLKCDFQKEKLGLIEKKKKDYFPFFVTVRYKTEPVCHFYKHANYFQLWMTEENTFS